MAERKIMNEPDAVAPARAFLDVEASGLGARSWPVEVGWAFDGGAPTAMLVRPRPEWSSDAWDPKAQALHGLDRERLEREGQDAREVCLAMNEALADAEVYSDAPDWDGFWLFRLFSAAGVRQRFSILDYGRMMRPLVAGESEALFRRVARLAPRRHRAGDDARHLELLHRLASRRRARRAAS